MQHNVTPCTQMVIMDELKDINRNYGQEKCNIHDRLDYVSSEDYVVSGFK